MDTLGLTFSLALVVGSLAGAQEPAGPEDRRPGILVVHEGPGSMTTPAIGAFFDEIFE